MSWFGLILFAMIGTIFGRAYLRAHREKYGNWAAAAKELGVNISKRSLLGPLELEGKVGDFEIFVEQSARGNEGETRTIYSVQVGHLIPFELKRGFGNQVWTMLHGDDVEIGDEEFDRLFRITGREEAILGALSRTVRKQLLATDLVSLDGGVLKSIGGDPDRRTLVEHVRRLVALAESLRVGKKSIEPKLLATFTEEWTPTVRRRQLAILLRTVTDPKIKEQAIELALASRDAELRLTAALSAGEKGFDTLAALAADVIAPDEVRARALARLPRETFDVKSLVKIRPDSQVKMRAAIAARLRDVPDDPELEAALFVALDDDMEEVQLAAARSLAVRGTVAAVEKLTACSQGVLKSIALKEATRAAINAIQSRAAGRDRGGLSLVSEDDRGALSVAAERGALSIEANSRKIS